ncbi:MAG: ribosome silencing factor [Chloroflexota bacterium]
MLDVSEICSFADYFVVCNGETERQLKAIVDEIDSALSKEHVPVPKPQGTTESGWLVLDLGDIIVHLFSPRQREFYTLEDMWENSSTILKIL